MTCAFLASCSSRASPRCFGARCVLICHKSVRFLQTCLAGYLCVSIQLVTHNHACRVVTHSATTPLDKYMLFLRAWESCQSIQPAFLLRKHSRSVGILMRSCGSWFLAIGESRQALQASTFSKQFCVDICQRLLEQLVLFTERCEQPCERGGRVDGRLPGSGFWCRGLCQLYAPGPVTVIRSGMEAWFGHSCSVFTSSLTGQSMHGSLQLLRFDIHREVCVLMRSVRMYFVRVHCDDEVFFSPSTSPFFGKVMPPSDI